MKIIFAWISAALLLLLAGCAGAPTHGGSGQALGGQIQGHGSASGSSDIVDYRQVLSDPGPF